MNADPYRNLEAQPLSWLASEKSNEINPYREAIQGEIARRVAQAQIDAARYMKWSVIAIAITSGITAMAAIGAWVFPNPLTH